MSVEPQLPKPGRPVVLQPAPSGMWAVLLGGSIAILAPMFGFLIGTAMGPGDPSTLRNPIYLGLFTGVLVGAVGVVLGMWGALRLFRNSRSGRGT